MIDQRRCATCANWFKSNAEHAFNGEDVGECHRYAPRPQLGLNESSLVAWPITRDTDVCGEWFFGGQQRPAITAENTKSAKGAVPKSSDAYVSAEMDLEDQ